MKIIYPIARAFISLYGFEGQYRRAMQTLYIAYCSRVHFTRLQTFLVDNTLLFSRVVIVVLLTCIAVCTTQETRDASLECRSTPVPGECG